MGASFLCFNNQLWPATPIALSPVGKMFFMNWLIERNEEFPERGFSRLSSTVFEVFEMFNPKASSYGEMIDHVA